MGKRRNKSPQARPTPEAVGGLRNTHSYWVLIVAGLLTLGLLNLSFPPFDVWPLAYVCLVPWLVTVAACEFARRTYIISYLLGAAFFCTTIYWLFFVTAIGSVVLFSIFAIHFPLIACPVRHLVRRRGWRLAYTFPFIWVGSECVRSMFLLEFPWDLLGHTQHAVLPMIQIADLVGAYGVSFVVAAANGAIADVLLCRRGWPSAEDAPTCRGVPRGSLVFAGAVIALTLVYGGVQWWIGRDSMRDGPKIAIIQGNYPNYVDNHPDEPTPRDRADRYFSLLDAAEQENPDLFLLPETPWFMYLNREYLEQSGGRTTSWMYSSRECYEAFRQRAIRYNAYVVTGAASVEPTPLDLKANERRYNSAFVFGPDGAPPQRYDKIHLVMIGEYVPFRYGPLRFVYLWINRIGPFYAEDFEYSLSAGDDFTTFAMSTPEGVSYTFATPICYENVMPYISRRFVLDSAGRKRCDFLLNLSNDGWFLHSSELVQHLAASVFRAVENRVGMARAVNTGISCFVDPDGRVRDMVTVDGRAVGPDVDGYRVAHVKVDSRRTLYSRWGDWFALACAILWIASYLDYVVARALAERRRKEQGE